MKTFLSILATFALIVGLFLGYTMLQTGNTVVDPHSADHPDAIATPDGNRQAIVGQGEDAWVEMRDADWRVTSRFRAGQYDPQKDGRVRVTAPEAVFFLSDGQRLRIRGKTGLVAMNRLPEPGEDPRSLGPRQMPTRGELRDVEIELFDSQKNLDLDSPESPVELLRITLDNAAFDNETFRIFTTDTEIDGRPIPRDRVPVIVTGRDYDFDGQGLTIRWNEVERRLDLLQIAHGGKLVIKNPEALDFGNKSTTSSTFSPAFRPGRSQDFSTFDLHRDLQSAGRSKEFSTSTRHHDVPVFSESPGTSAGLNGNISNPLQFADASDQSLAQALGPQKPAYRATFTDNVRILQADTELARADELFADFQLDSTQSTPPATNPTPKPQNPKPQTPTPTPSSHLKPQVTSNKQPATSAPITLLWTGSLTVTPLPDDAPRPAPAGATVHLIGSPLLLKQEQTDVQARSLVYDTAARTLAVSSSEAYPLVLKDGRGGSVESESLDYSITDQTAVFKGKSRALLPLRADDVAHPQALTAQWSDSATLHLAGEGLESLAADRATLTGEVKIHHPALSLSAKSLDLAMDSAGKAGNMQLKTVAARGDVHCEVRDDNQAAQTIDAGELKIATAVDPAGRLYVRHLEADDHVRATDPKQSFKAGHLTATLSPAAADITPAGAGDSPLAQRVNLEHFIAQGGAEYAAIDGKRAAADQIEVLVKDGHPFLTLLGDAKLSDGTNILYGPHIQVAGADQKATVLGGGSLEAKRQTDPNAEARAVSVEWKKGVIADGQANRVTVSGGVIVTTSEADGTSLALSGSQLEMVLADAPAKGDGKADAKANDKDNDKADAKVKTDRPLMQDKVVQTVTMSGDTEVRALRMAEDGAILRRFNLAAESLTYDLPNRKMTVPVRGRLLFEDHPARDAAAPKKEQESLAGATAMKWDRQLSYDETTGQITLEGDVLIVHESDDKKEQPGFRLDAQKVTAQLATGTDAKPATKPAGNASPAGRDLKKITAEKSVHFQARDLELSAEKLEYDPTAGVMTATGSMRDPVQVLQGLSKGSFSEARFNLRTGQLQVTDFKGNVR